MGRRAGQALIGGLLAGLESRKVEVRTSARAEALIDEDGAIRGLIVNGERLEGRVVLASGGFQHDPTLRAAFLPGTAVAPLGTRGCAGDGLRMSMGVGAALGNMTEGWWMPAIAVPGEELDGVQHYRPLHTEHAQPGAILVDRAGHRFVDEAQNYADVGRAMQRFDPYSYSFPASPCWIVFDARYRARYPFGPLMPDDLDPAWLHRADDLASLGDATPDPCGRARRQRGPVQRRSPPWRGSRLRARHPTLRALDRRSRGAAPDARMYQRPALLRRGGPPRVSRDQGWSAYRRVGSRVAARRSSRVGALRRRQRGREPVRHRNACRRMHDRPGAGVRDEGG